MVGSNPWGNKGLEIGEKKKETGGNRDALPSERRGLGKSLSKEAEQGSERGAKDHQGAFPFVAK